MGPKPITSSMISPVIRCLSAPERWELPSDNPFNQFCQLPLKFLFLAPSSVPVRSPGSTAPTSSSWILLFSLTKGSGLSSQLRRAMMMSRVQPGIAQRCLLSDCVFSLVS